MPEQMTTAVLIHGAWAGGWVWETITPYLKEQGFNVMAPDLPGCGSRLGNPADASLSQCVDDLEKMLQKVEGPLLLVGHSGAVPLQPNWQKPFLNESLALPTWRA